MAVRIRMKKMGRKHRPFFRICATDGRAPRDGRVLEQLGTYDPLIPEIDARAILKSERIQYWLSVGAKPSDKVSVLIKKYGAGGTHVAAQQAALDRLAQQRRRAESSAPMPRASKPKKTEQDALPARKSDAEKIRNEAEAAEENE
ncbi:MAG TPA: 30S ribosomal protein S16 [Thermoguttaceae bacterium]